MSRPVVRRNTFLLPFVSYRTGGFGKALFHWLWQERFRLLKASLKSRLRDGVEAMRKAADGRSDPNGNCEFV
jgi:hypothetical protein